MKKEKPAISTSGMPAFEESFHHFAADLAALAFWLKKKLHRVYHLLGSS